MSRFPLMALLMAASFSAGATTSPNKPVEQLDLDRYKGTWHEIARLPMFFQRKCAGDVVAVYTPRPDGTITVDNSCRKTDGSRQQSVGMARKVEGKPGQLEVSFTPKWLAWIPAVWGDYWVIELDPDYQWAMVGGPSRDNLWILSRTEVMKKSQFDKLKASAKAKGYPVEKLVMSGRLLD